MDWEGPEALEETTQTEPKPTRPTSRRLSRPSKPARAEESEESEAEQKPVPAEVSESSDDASEDEYVDEDGGGKSAAGKRSRRKVAASSDSEPDNESTNKASTSKSAQGRRASVASAKSTSPTPTHLKRKQSTAAQSTPPVKRKKSEAGSSAADDATRKYCLTKLTELFSGIFNKYPFVDVEGEGEPVEKAPEDLSDDEKVSIANKASVFSVALEQCMYESYSEPDKQGKPNAGGKYKERFRMITFNLQQADRIALHKHITSGKVTPAQISVMSSTDLASEDRQQAIKLAEQEALEHSILQKATVPRAKITHKGLQDIEDVNEELTKQREREIARENEEEERERRERERLLRIRPVTQGSMPPESPITPHTPSTWGAPPPVPGSAGMPGGSRPPTNPLFIPSVSDFSQNIEHELNLGDFIHMDDEPPSDELLTPDLMRTPAAVEAPDPMHTDKQTKSTLVPTPVQTTGISPFAASKPDMPPRASFDLNALWTAQEDGAADEDKPVEHPPTTHEQDTHVPMSVDVAADVDVDVRLQGVAEAGDDLDFDMFLGDNEDKPTAPEAAQVSPEELFENLPRVWSGIVSMPIDSGTPQEIRVDARPVGGRSLEPNSVLWQTLFPVDHLRIDGRVPVPASSQYLLQSRMNSTKELVAVVFSTDTEADQTALRSLSDYLLAKERHGLIFPWGNRGRDWGKELYVIPLLQAHTIPDYIDILDDLKIPKDRKKDYLVGIWVLQRGKLAPLPARRPQPQLQAQPQPHPQPLPTPQFPSFSPPNAQPGFAPTPLPANLTQFLASQSLAVPSMSQPSMPIISPSLAASVASLSQEQQGQLHSALSSLQTPAFPAANPAPANTAASAPTSAILSGLLQSILVQAGVAPTAHVPPPPATWPPPPHSFPSAQSPHHALPIPHPQPPPPPPVHHERYPPYDRHDIAPHRGGRQWDERDDRERGRGRRGGRARGRGSYDDHDRDLRPIDSGWASRRGGRGRGGPPGPSDRYDRRGPY
ncbi:hypothetical protein FA95DRAFT_1560046 [Auriscalpium vulgare]|uniref:Uncharacterized protein n=1 Tax=Auriscalpium vulgare TaxID=40419 RepID=A0ACB8RSM0_9AGAM|nr:hypothetical protein FA95DRAFT_1560046 [Auriscalpium vulgare]